MLFAQRWEQVQLSAPYDSGYYLDIYFLPSQPQYGWACSQDSGYVVRTTNGGQTWMGSRVVQSGFCHLEYIQFLNTQVGYCTGPCGVYKSTDGGASWFELNLGYPDSMVWGGWFKDEYEGWATGGSCGVNNFYHTTDGGTSWERFRDTTVKRSNMSDPLWQGDMPAGTVYAVGNGTLWKSTNSGSTWSPDSYTGTTSPWHEEISKLGNTIMVSCAGNNCGSDYTTGGMRWTHDGGSNWYEFNTGSDMFGVYLLSAQHAWAAGYAGNVWQTLNGGTSWALRNCGLPTKHMDDILFLNDSTGWVVGQGIYRLAPPRRTLSDSVVWFLDACPDSVLRDTVWVTNENFFPSDWTIELVGTHSYMYRVANVVPTPLPSCKPTMVIVEYKATVPGLNSADMIIRIQNPDTTLVVQLRGRQRMFNAVPADTLIEFRHPVGKPVNRVLEWFATAPPLEEIRGIARDSGSSDLSLTGTYPVKINVGPPTAQTIISGTLRDTGWVATKFLVQMQPCLRDTTITVRVYGESGIIDSDTVLTANTGCAASDTLYLPVSNSGNAPLTVFSAQLLGLGTEAFTILGMKRAGTNPPWKIDVGKTDTLAIVVTPTSNIHQVVLQLNNDDLTTARGVKTPRQVTISVQSMRVEASVTPQMIDLGTVCTGTWKDTAFTITNTGPTALSYTLSGLQPRFMGLGSGSVSIPRNDHRNVPFRWSADSAGSYLDTIAIKIRPCDSVCFVVVRATVVELNIASVTESITGSIEVGKTLVRSATVVNHGSQTVRVTSVQLIPPDSDLVVNALTPLDLAGGDSIKVEIQFTPDVVRRYSGKLLVDVDGICRGTITIPVDVRSISNRVTVSTTEILFRSECDLRIQTDSIKISGLSGQVAMKAPTINQTGNAFNLVMPTVPFTVSANQEQWVVVQYRPANSRNAVAVLELETADGSDRFDVQLSGSATWSDWVGTPSAINFGDLRVCDSVQVSQIEVRNNDSVAVTVNVNTSGLPTWLDIPASRIDVPPFASEFLTVRCLTSQLQIGNNQYRLVLTDETCRQLDTVEVLALLADGALVAEPAEINISVAVGTSTTQTVRVINPTRQPRKIIDVHVVGQQSSWSIETPVTDSIVQPADTVIIRVVFAPLTEGIFNTTLRITQAERCTTITDVALNGEAVQKGILPSHTVRLVVNDYTVPAGSRIAVPVYLEGSMKDAIPDSMAFRVSFSALHLLVDTVYQGTIPDAQVEHSYNNGQLIVQMRKDGPEFGNGGSVVVIEGTAMPALPDSTIFTFADDSVWSAQQVEVRHRPGVLIVDVCGPRNYVMLANPTTITVQPPVPVGDRVNIQIDAPYSEHLSVSVIDMQSNRVITIPDIQVGKGLSNLAIPLHSLPSGMYIVHIQSNRGGVFTLPVPVVR